MTPTSKKEDTTLLCVRGDVKVITYHRRPTLAELKFGYGAIHYKDFPVDVCITKEGRIKKWLVCPHDGLRYFW